jgi:hypothetical protein
MAAPLTNLQAIKLIEVRNLTHLYQANRLRMLINDYLRNNQQQSEHTRKDHQVMIQYFEELLNLTANNQLTK